MVRGVELEAASGVIFGAEGLVKVLYQSVTIFRTIGAVTGRCYTFSGDKLSQYVDRRDLPAMLNWQTQDGGPLLVEA